LIENRFKVYTRDYKGVTGIEKSKFLQYVLEWEVDCIEPYCLCSLWELWLVW